jgi:hypothetical protein
VAAKRWVADTPPKGGTTVSTPEERWHRHANARPVDQTARAFRTVAAYDNYPDAERAVDFLSDHDFPVEGLALVGRGTHSVERVTGRATYGSEAGKAAASGAIVGALFGWLFGLFDLVNPLISALLLALLGAGFGALIGAVVGLIAHALTGGRRDFASVTGIQADSYELQVPAESAERARKLLADPSGPGIGSGPST